MKFFILDYLRSLVDSFIAWSHNLHTRTGVNQSRSGTQRLFGEQFSQTPSPQFRLKKFIYSKFKIINNILHTNDVIDLLYY